jgi:hypothetical protein
VHNNAACGMSLIMGALAQVEDCDIRSNKKDGLDVHDAGTK